MDKLRALMQKCGIRPELSDKLCESFEQHLVERRKQQDAEFRRMQEEAKRVCLEEVGAHKLDLARRLQIFCEAKGAHVEQVVAKQTAIKESAAQAKLQSILGFLEGVEPNGRPNGNLQAENKKLKRQLQKLSEEQQRAVTAANRNSALAAKVLAKNRLLETELQRTRNGHVVPESRTTRLDKQRQRRPSGEAVTTRQTLRENQERPAQRKQQAAPAPAAPETFSVSNIAQLMESDLI